MILKNAPCFPALLWLLSFVCALYPINDWQLGLFAAAISINFFWAFWMLSARLSPGWVIPKSAVTGLAAAFWALVVASAFWAEVKPAALMGLCMFTVMPLTFFTGVIAGGADYFKTILRGLVVIFGVLAAWAVVQFFFLNVYFHGQARHPLADPSSLGALLSLALFGGMGWLCKADNSRARCLALAFCALMLCGIMATVARAPVFAFIPAFAVFAWFLWPMVKARKKEFVALLVVVIGFQAMTVMGVQKKTDIVTRLAETALIAESPANNRLAIWQSSFDIIKNHPFLGTGYSTFFLYYPEFRKASERDGVLFAHNDPIQYWVELGILGPLLFYGFVVACAWRSVKTLKTLQGNDRIVVASVLAALIALVIGSHVGFSLYNMSILMMTGLMLSIWYLSTGKVLSEKTAIADLPPNLPPGIGKALLALPFALSIWILSGLTAGEIYASKASENLFKEDMMTFMVNINKAGRMSQDMNSRAYLLAANVPMSILEFKKGKMDDEEEKKLYAQINDYMGNALAINPREASAYYYLGKVQTLISSRNIPQGTEIPEEYYKKTLKLDPLHLGARLALYKLYRGMKKSPEELLAVMEAGKDFHYATPVVMEYYGELSKLYIETKNYVKMKEVMQKMANFKKKSDSSAVRQKTPLPQAVIGGDAIFQKAP